MFDKNCKIAEINTKFGDDSVGGGGANLSMWFGQRINLGFFSTFAKFPNQFKQFWKAYMETFSSKCVFIESKS